MKLVGFNQLFVHRVMILGKKRMIPVIAAESALNKTAAAAKSFTFLIWGCFSGETKSASASSEVLINSQIKPNLLRSPKRPIRSERSSKQNQEQLQQAPQGHGFAHCVLQ